jgi:hypothetical protein
LIPRRPYVPAPERRSLEPVNPGVIKAGFFLTRLVRDGILVPVLIEFAPPRDPATAEILDRSPRWCMNLNGSWTNAQGELWGEEDILHTYLFAARRPISAEEYAYKVARQQHMLQHEPDMPEAEPRKRLDYNRLRPIY